MWSSFPLLAGQPAAEFSSSDPLDASWPRVARACAQLSAPPTVTLTSEQESVKAVHCVFELPNAIPSSGIDLRIRLGDHYALRVRDEQISAFEVDIVKASWLRSTDYYLATFTHVLLAELLDGEAVLSSAKMLSLDGRNASSTLISQQRASRFFAVSFGYSLNAQSNEMKLYGHFSMPVFVEASVACGSKTVGLAATIDPSKATPDKAYIIIDNLASLQGIPTICCHPTVFSTSTPFVMERSDVRHARTGTRIGSRRSRATLFATPQPNSVTDSAGHPESHNFAVAVAGQPDHDVAWVPQSTTWRANCGFTEAQNVKTSKLSVVGENLFFRSEVITTQFGYVEHGPFSVSVDELSCTSYGNNEYFGHTDDDPGFPQSPQNGIDALVMISGREFESGGLMTLRYDVVVAFAARLANGFNELVGTNLRKTLTEAEADAFFSGTPLEITADISVPLFATQTQKVTLTAIGT